MKSILSHLTAPLCLSLTLCFFMGCANDTQKAPGQPSEPITEVNEPPLPSENAAADDTITDTTTGTDSSTQTPSRDSMEVDPIDTRQPTPVTSTTAGVRGLPGRDVDQERLSVVLDLIAQELEAQELKYDRTIGQDCSGIYHKIKDMLQRKFSALGDKSKYTYPSFSPDRNTREIAHWYHRHNNLHIVQDGLADRNLIRPGSVMFFGRTDESYSNLTIDMLTNPGVFRHDAATGKGKIYHVATVTKVERDEEGNVVQYTIMHGRNSKHTASRTGGNWETCCETGKMHQKFPFGNHNQQWVAVANIETTVE